MQVGRYYQTEISNFGFCSIKVLENSLLIISEKPILMTVMSGSLGIYSGIKEISKESFDEIFKSIQSKLNELQK